MLKYVMYTPSLKILDLTAHRNATHNASAFSVSILNFIFLFYCWQCFPNDNSPGLPNDRAVGELGDEGPLLKDDDEELSDTFRKSNDGDASFGDSGRATLPSMDPIFFKELLLRKPVVWLRRRPKRFQNGRCLGVFSTSGVEGRLVGEEVFFLVLLVRFRTRLMADGRRRRPPVLMDVLESSVALSLTLFPPPSTSSTTWRCVRPVTD